MATYRIEDLAHATAYDAQGEKLGSIKDVYLDELTGQPDFVDVNHGLFGMNNSIVPLRGHQLKGRELHLAFTKDRISDAPDLNIDGHLTSEDQANFYRHYGVETLEDTHVRDEKFGGFAGAGAAAAGVGAAGAVSGGDPAYNDEFADAGRGSDGIEDRREAQASFEQDIDTNARIAAKLGRNDETSES